MACSRHCARTGESSTQPTILGLHRGHLFRVHESMSSLFMSHILPSAALWGIRAWGTPASPTCLRSSSTRSTTTRCSSPTRTTLACRQGSCVRSAPPGLVEHGSYREYHVRADESDRARCIVGFCRTSSRVFIGNTCTSDPVWERWKSSFFICLSGRKECSTLQGKHVLAIPQSAGARASAK